MIIKSIKLQPFGCHADREISFQAGLNVILGPNEAGKSTIFNAIQKALLLPTTLYKRDFEGEMQCHIPISGGDSVHLEMEFEQNDKTYLLKKTWGAGKAASLRLPDGAIVASDDKVSERLQSLLPAKVGTVRSVLMTYQSGLERTLADLQDERETIQGLGDLLRKAVLATDGISVEGFVAKIQAQVDGYYSRWDSGRRYPEANRGIENPWKRDVGVILEAFYDKERLRVDYEAAVAYESALDKLSREISAATESIARRNAYVKENQKIMEDVKKRRTLMTEAELSSVKITGLKEANAGWPVLEQKIGDLERRLLELRARVQTLAKEKEAAQTAETNRALKEQYERAVVKKASCDTAESELAKVQKLDRNQLDGIQAAQQRLEKISASVAAGKVAVTFKPRKDITVKVQRDLELMRESALEAGKVYHEKAGGRLAVEYADLELEITSGEGKFEEIKKQHEQAEKELQSLLAACEVATLDQAQSVHRTYQDLLDKVNRAKAVLEGELQGVLFEELEANVKAAGAGTSVRPLAEVMADLVQEKANETQTNNDITESRKTLDGYKAKYGDQEKLLDELVKVRQKEKESEKEIAGLAPLPVGITDMDAYQKEYDDNLSALNEDEKKLNELQLKQAEMTGAAPDYTSEDLRGPLEESEKQFQAVLRKGAALTRILAAAKELVSGAGGDIYQELGKGVAKIASIITNKKYENVQMDSSLPGGFVRDDGKVIVYDLLSHGTKDMLGFALRLAIAKHYLGDAKGFLAMDDPLVNMDPERQQKAADVIKDFAQEKQVMIFTCHPGHTEMLGGNVISL